MKDAPDEFPWLAVMGLLVCIAVVALSSCQSLRRLQPPYHEPAVRLALGR
jgi:hypothetical protein